MPSNPAGVSKSSDRLGTQFIFPRSLSSSPVMQDRVCSLDFVQYCGIRFVRGVGGMHESTIASLALASGQTRVRDPPGLQAGAMLPRTCYGGVLQHGGRCRLAEFPKQSTMSPK